MAIVFKALASSDANVIFFYDHPLLQYTPLYLLIMTFQYIYIYIYIYIYKFMCIMLCTHVYIHNYAYTYQIRIQRVYSVCRAFLFWFYKTQENLSNSKAIFILNTMLLYYNPSANPNDC